MMKLSKVRRYVESSAFAVSIGVLIATPVIFMLCYFGYFSNENVEIADHLQDVLQMIVGWLFCFTVLALIAAFLGGGKRFLFTVIFSCVCGPALAFLFFINGMRRN